MPLADSKPQEVVYFAVTNPADMMAALMQAPAIAYYGAITMSPDGEFLISLTGPGNPRIDGHVGEVFVWNGQSLAVLAQQEFLAQYTPK